MAKDLVRTLADLKEEEALRIVEEKLRQVKTLSKFWAMPGAGWKS